DELQGAHAPVGLAMLGGAFVFGATMQIVLGCGSGVLVNAGSGNLMAVLALLGFIAGSFLGTLHLQWWTALGSLPVLTLQGSLGERAGLWLTLIGLAALAVLVVRLSTPGQRLPSVRLWLAAILVAALAILNLMVAGQSWGVVYGLGLWGAKVGQAVGLDVLATGFWAAPDHAERLRQSLLTDVTSLTNIGIIVGAFVAMRWRLDPGPQVPLGNTLGRLGILVSGLLLGYSARIAFGCNVGAYFSGIATGSVHGWVRFASAFAGSALALQARPRVLRWLSLNAAATSAAAAENVHT
ncbi:MAG: YeeE/YedE thiosulfate transporter family protein, partial [Lamprobacter sp.]|uniref:YeeE/YedE thiosulfate transporter family protein n=1 Tax=Lamprobacter sp. TaxID=3100796 RepID=UPI002B25D9E9